MPIPELILRLFLTFITLLLLARLMGRKEISQLTFFNFVSAITIGSIGAALATRDTLSITNGMIALVGWTLFTIVLGFIDIKSKNARLIAEGQPVILIKNGEIMESAMRKVRLDIDALKSLLREKSVFSVSDVDYAIFETNGKLSVLKKEPKQPVTKGDMNVQPLMTNVYPTESAVISDGEIVSSNLKKLNLDQKWVEHQLQLSGIHSISDVFYAELQKDGSLYIDKRDDNVH